MASVLTFFLTFGLGNVLFFLPAETLDVVGLVPDVTPAMVKLMWLVVMGAIGMWIGYWLPIASRLASPVVKQFVARWFSNSDRPRKLSLPVLVGFGVSTRLIQIKLGIFGYGSSYDQLIEMGALTQYFAMGASLGTAALVVSSLEYFSERPMKGARAWFACVFVIEVGFGLLSGFKSAVALPFVIAGVCKYLRSGVFRIAWLIWFVAALSFAYAAIEPFRAIKRSSDFQGTSATSLVDLFIESRSDDVFVANSTPVWVSVVARSSLVYVGSLGVSFKDEFGDLPEGSPKFLSNIALAPVYALIPRLLWKNKPVGDLGLWYTNSVVGSPTMSSTAMGPVTYLYFGGGAVAVVIGFLIFGVFQKLVVLLMRPSSGAARAFVYLSILPSIANIDSAVDGTVVNIVRMIPLLFVLQYFIYQRCNTLLVSDQVSKGVR